MNEIYIQGRVYILLHVKADPLQLAELTFFLHVLVVEPPVARYPVKHEKVQVDPTFLELVQETSAFVPELRGAGQFVAGKGHRITVLENASFLI